MPASDQSVCAHRAEYRRLLGRWGAGRPAPPSAAAGGGTSGGSASPGIEADAAFRGWYLIRYDAEHVDPCGQ